MSWNPLGGFFEDPGNVCTGSLLGLIIGGLMVVQAPGYTLLHSSFESCVALAAATSATVLVWLAKWYWRQNMFPDHGPEFLLVLSFISGITVVLEFRAFVDVVNPFEEHSWEWAWLPLFILIIPFSYIGYVVLRPVLRRTYSRVLQQADGKRTPDGEDNRL